MFKWIIMYPRNQKHSYPAIWIYELQVYITEKSFLNLVGSASHRSPVRHQLVGLTHTGSPQQTWGRSENPHLKQPRCAAAGAAAGQGCREKLCSTT